MTHASEDSERALIDALEALFSPSPSVLVGIGDDAAVLSADARPSVLSVDAAVEGTHFDLAWIDHDQVAFRAFMAAASDLPAMGAAASHALCAWTLPPGTGRETVQALARGTQRAAEACGMAVVGGNLSRGPLLSLTTTVVGHLDGPALTRCGARVGQTLHVTGPVGSSRLGLEALRLGRNEAAPFVAAFAAPRARCDLQTALSAAARSAIDLSDGLLADLSQLCRQSGVGARVQVERLPRVAGFDECARGLGLDPVACLLAGGEEYEILFTADAASLPFATAIGSIEPLDAGVTAVDAQGGVHVPSESFRHF